MDLNLKKKILFVSLGNENNRLDLMSLDNNKIDFKLHCILQFVNTKENNNKI